MSAPPEVVFNTATDPARSSWLPEPLRRKANGRSPSLAEEALWARWDCGEESGWMAQLQVRPIEAGGARVRLELVADPPEDRLDDLANDSLASLARAVVDNLNAG
ncbi:hypothetical protein [Micromonospora sonneratiae]|uniref:Uncharacterized protein n=1 Tax=Micromonospora sonneratiae TaxID=1184706 RepID=A0ABW3YBT0_9ACTN